MNELGIRDLEVVVNILDLECYLKEQIVIATTLLNLLPNLQVFKLTM